MLSFDIAIRNPWTKDDFKDLWSMCGDFPERYRLLKTKGWELQLSRYSGNLLSLHIDLSWRGRSHAGPSIEICLLGVVFEAQIIDCRHWDHAKGTWEEIDEDPSEFKHDFEWSAKK